MAKETQQKEQIKYIHGFCKPDCEHLVTEECISFANHPETMKIDYCTHSGHKTSFGCLSSCPLNQSR